MKNSFVKSVAFVWACMACFSTQGSRPASPQLISGIKSPDFYYKIEEDEEDRSAKMIAAYKNKLCKESEYMGGIAYYYSHESTMGNALIASLYVSIPYRKQGVATALMRHALTDIKNKVNTPIYLEAVNFGKDNIALDDLVRFYQKQGARELFDNRPYHVEMEFPSHASLNVKKV